jgi:hypothetical protein
MSFHNVKLESSSTINRDQLIGHSSFLLCSIRGYIYTLFQVEVDGMQEHHSLASTMSPTPHLAIPPPEPFLFFFWPFLFSI